MLPFLKDKRKEGGSATQHISSEGKIMPGDSPDMGLLSASEDLIRAIDSRDPQRVAQALKAAFMICDSEPHEEGEHT